MTIDHTEWYQNQPIRTALHGVKMILIKLCKVDGPRPFMLSGSFYVLIISENTYLVEGIRKDETECTD